MTEKRRPGRPKGSGAGLVNVGLRIEPDVLEALEEFAAVNQVKVSLAVRHLLKTALGSKDLTGFDAGYLEGMREGRADFHQFMADAWKKLAP